MLLLAFTLKPVINIRQLPVLAGGLFKGVFVLNIGSGPVLGRKRDQIEV